MKTIITSGLALGLVAASYLTATAQEIINYATDGGAILEAKRNNLIGPAEKKLGVRVIVDANTDRYPAFKAQVLSGSPTWNLIDFSAGFGIRAEAENLLEPLDYSKIPNAEGVPAAYKDKYIVGLNAYATVLGYNKTKFGDHPPRTWADFWNVKDFPGRRAMRNGPRPTLEIALLADGVKPENLYPLDVDRAYAKLKEIKPYINLWWSSGAESTQLMYDNEVDLMQIWDGRAMNAVKEGADGAFGWNQSLVEYGAFAIPKGSKNPQATMALINEMLEPKGQADWATEYATGPLNTKFADFMDPKVLKDLPTAPENLKTSIPVNNEWWASEAGQEAERRWLSFMQN